MAATAWMRCMSERILVVEDDDQIAAIVRDGLSRMGYRVELAADGPAALAAVRAGAGAGRCGPAQAAGRGAGCRSGRWVVRSGAVRARPRRAPLAWREQDGGYVEQTDGVPAMHGDTG